jgi:hypothetical protein
MMKSPALTQELAIIVWLSIIRLMMRAILLATRQTNLNQISWRLPLLCIYKHVNSTSCLVFYLHHHPIFITLYILSHQPPCDNRGTQHRVVGPLRRYQPLRHRPLRARSVEISGRLLILWLLQAFNQQPRARDPQLDLPPQLYHSQLHTVTIRCPSPKKVQHEPIIPRYLLTLLFRHKLHIIAKA